MRNFRKALASLSVIAILSSFVASTTVFASTFDDVSADKYYYEAVEALVDADVIAAKDSYNPKSKLQRQEAAKLIVNSAGLEAAIPETGHFMDVPTSLWSYDYVETAFANGVVNGYSDDNGDLTGYFGPSDTVTRAQFAKMVVEAFNLEIMLPDSPTFPDVSNADAWYYEYVETAAYYGVVTGYSDTGMFGPNDLINRADGAVMIHRAMGEPTPVDDDDDDDDDTPVEVGEIEISLGDTPDTNVIPLSATHVPFLVMDVEGEGTLKSLTFERFGAGNTSDFENVYLYEGAKRLTSGRTINSSTHRVTFTGLNYDVDGMSELTLVADMSATGNGNVDGFRLYDVSSDDDVYFGDVEGELMSISNASVGSMTISKTGSLTNPKVGEDDVKIAEFRLEAGSSEMVEVNAITLYQVGSIARSDLTNFVLLQGGEEVASVDMIDDEDNILLEFYEPYEMDKGASRTFELYADVEAGARDGDTIKIYLDNKSDLDVVGQTYGWGVQVTRTAYDNSASNGTDASWSTVEGGQITISFMGPSVQDYATDMQDVELMRFNIVAQNQVEIKNTSVTLTSSDGDVDTDDNGLIKGNATAANFTDIKLIDTESGDVLAGPFDIALATANDMSYSKTLTDVWNLEAGEDRVLAFTADIENYTPLSDETIKIQLNAFGGSDIKNLENNQYVATADIVPSSAVVGNDHRVKAANTTMSVAGTPSAQDYINGSDDLDMLGVILRAGEGKDVYLKSLTVTALGVNSCATETDCILTVSLWDGDTQVGSTKSLSTNTATFNSLNVKVEKGTSKTLTVKADLNTLASVAGGTTLAVEVSANTDATVQDSDGNSVTVTGTATGVVHNILDAGTLNIVKAPVESGVTDSRVVVAGTEKETLAKYKFTASNEDLMLSKAAINIGAATKEVESVYLYDGTTMVAGPVTPESDGIARFSAFTEDFIVENDDTKVLTVKADLSTISDGAVSGTAITATFVDQVDFEARGTSSNTVITDFNTNAVDDSIAGDSVVLRKTKMTLTKRTISPTLINGLDQEAYKFSVEADSAEDVSIKELVFDVNESDAGATGSISNLELYRNGDIINVVTLTADSLAAPTSITAVFTSEEVISAGTSNEYTLKLQPAGYADGDSVSVSLTETAAATATNTAAALSGAANIIWSDNSAIPHDPATSSDWMNGYLLKTLPLGALSLVKES